MILHFQTHYKKALKVINSCQNRIQLDGAESYINNLINYHSSSSNGVFDFPDQAIVDKVNYLIKKIQEKKSKLS